MNKDKVGRYEIIAKLGQGGMGAVYRAFDPHFKREVALKVLDKRFTHDPKFKGRFQREAQAVARIDHPGVVPIYDYGDDAGELFLVMQLMPGGTLTDRLKDGPLPLDEARRILQQMAPALDHTHSQGMVHRDLKPDNILFDAYDVPLLADFGIVKMVGSQATLTEGAMVGTPAYMSPEQVKGEKEIDGRSDIYSLGVILFQMVTGQRPYRADTPIQMLMQHINAPVPSILEVRPDLPVGYETIIRRAMSKEPGQRYPTVTALVQELENVNELPLMLFAEQMPPPSLSLAPPVETPAATVTAPARRLRPTFLAAGILIVLLLLGAGGAFLLRGVGETAVPPTPTNVSNPTTPMEAADVVVVYTPASPVPPTAPLPTETPTVRPSPTLTPTPQIEPLPITAENLTQLTLAQVFQGAAERLNSVAVSPDEQWLAVAGSQSVALYQLPDMTRARTIVENRAAGVVAWSRDGRYLAIAQTDGVHIWDSATWTETSQLSGEIATALAWSPVAEELLLGTADGRVSQWLMGETAVQSVWRDHHSPISQIAWTPDGAFFASGSNENLVWIYDLATGASNSVYRQNGTAGLAWSPDGDLLATAGRDGYVRLVDVTGNAKDTLLLNTVLSSITWVDEQTLAVGTQDGRIHIWPIAERKPSSEMSRHSNVSALYWLPLNNQLLSVGGNDQTVRLWQGVATIELARLFDYASYRSGTVIGWSPATNLLAVGNNDGTVHVWSPETGEIVVVSGGHEQEVTSLAWSPDGSWLATSGQPDNSVRIWEAATGELVTVLEGHTAKVTGVIWSADSTQSASTGFDSVLRIWDFASASQTTSYQVNALGPALALAWSPDGAKIVVSGQTGLVQIRPPDRQERTITLSGHNTPVKALAWAIDGSRFASGDNGGQIRIWDTAVSDNGAPILTIHSEGGIRSVAWSPDDTILAVTSGINVQFWDTAQGDWLYTLTDQHPFNGNTAWSADGKLLATVGADGLVQIWHVVAHLR